MSIARCNGAVRDAESLIRENNGDQFPGWLSATQFLGAVPQLPTHTIPSA